MDRSMERSMGALLKLSSKGQLVIPARLRQLLGLKAGDRLELTLEQGLLLRRPQACATRSSDELIDCCGYQGPPIPLELQDPALQAGELWNWVG
ncbi:MAG: AbrB/MazE/SpoVT family DNA-binding domain-containing protein [Cyanobacteriota bacterium]|nr:AbrB/MazE/SpoVT family DNA-binding domain-containing protein [Cyanobacteriota bacterium]